MDATDKPTVTSERIMSVDALRGFDMFWIANGKEVIVALIALFIYPLPHWLDVQLEHIEWAGFSAWDMIMPLFLFIAGTSMPFSFSRRIEGARGGKALYLRIARRLALLWILGMFAQGHLGEAILTGHFSKLHFYSNTLQSIAAGYLVASIALLNFPVAGQIGTLAVMLIGYCLLMTFVPFHGHPAGTLEPHANLAMYIDETLLGRFRDGTPYTWILSSMGFAGSVLLGVMSGHILRAKRSQKTRLAGLLAMGAGCLALGWVWSYWFPIIKHIWTSSMVLWAAGWSYLLLAFFYAVIDMAGFRKWAFPFVVIGMNAIVAYVGAPIIGGLLEPDKAFRGALGSPIAVWQTFAVFIVPWLILLLLYRKKVFVRV